MVFSSDSTARGRDYGLPALNEYANTRDTDTVETEPTDGVAGRRTNDDKSSRRKSVANWLVAWAPKVAHSTHTAVPARPASTLSVWVPRGVGVGYPRTQRHALP